MGLLQNITRSLLVSISVLLSSCLAPHDLIITNVNIVDIESGAISTKDVFIQDSVIIKISNPDPSSRKARVVLEGADHFLIPGLWDMHVHIPDASYFSAFLDYGIIGVRDMGGCAEKPTDGCESACPDQLYKWKQLINRGELQGPHLRYAGRVLSGTGSPTSLPALTIEQVNEAFQLNVNDHVDFIKVYDKIPKEAYREIARLSMAYGLEFAGHASESLLLSEISDLGQKSIEHLREPILLCFTDDQEKLEAFMVADDYSEEDRTFVQPWVMDAHRVIENFKKNQTWYTPTLAIQKGRLRYYDSVWVNHPDRHRLPVSVYNGFLEFQNQMITSTDKKGDSLWWKAHTKLVNRLSREGIGLLAGSDAACEGGIPGYTLHEELMLMVEEAGLTPLQALQTATLNPCLYFKLKRRGKITENNYADLVLLNANPISNIRNTQSIAAVIKNGIVVRQ